MYMSERYLSNPRPHHPLTSFCEDRIPRSSPYFRNENNRISDDGYHSSKYREDRRIDDDRIGERPFSPRDRNNFISTRSPEPDLRDYLIASQRHSRNVSDFVKDSPNYNRNFEDHRRISPSSDWKYVRNIDIKSRMDQESMDLRNREPLTRREYRDDKYLYDSERDRRFSDMRDEKYDPFRGRYSPEHREHRYLSEPRRDVHVDDYRGEIHLNDSRREKYSSDFRDVPNFRRGWPSPNGRREETSDYIKCLQRDQNYREFLSESSRHRQEPDERRFSEFERDWRHPDENYKNYPFSSQRDSRYSDPKYMDPSVDRWRDPCPDQRYERSLDGPPSMVPFDNVRTLTKYMDPSVDRRRDPYPDQRYERSLDGPPSMVPFDNVRTLTKYMDPSGDRRRDPYPDQRYERSLDGPPSMVPFANVRTLSELNHQGRRMDYKMEDPRMDYKIEDPWKNVYPSQRNDEETFSNKNSAESDDEKLDSFSPVNNRIPLKEIPKTPFATGDALPRIEMEGAPLPKFTVLFQYLYNYNQPFTIKHALYVKNMILKLWERLIFRKKRIIFWLPKFLDCIRRHNGFAIVCANKKSYEWLLNQKIIGLKGFFFASSDAATPIKRAKICFQVPDEGIPATEVLKKLHMCNRGNQINFDRIKVINAKRSGGNLNVMALSDSWTVGRIKKKLNWRPRYGNRRIHILLLGKKKKKATSTQPGESKQPNTDQKCNMDELNEVEDDTFSESYDEL